MKKRTKQVAAGSVLAAGLGLVVGLLTASKSGRETRQHLRKSSIKAKREAERQLKRAHSELSKILERGSAQVKLLNVKARSGAQESLRRARAAKKKASEMLSAIHEGDAEDEDLKKVVDDVNAAVKDVKKYLKKPVTSERSSKNK